MFTRSMTVLLSGMSEEQLKNYGRSDRSPVFMRAAAEFGPGRWNRYSARDVVLIAVAERLRMQIGYAEGLRPDTAAQIASNAAQLGLEDALTQRTAIWAGYVGSPDGFEDRGAGENRIGGFNVSGSLQEIAARIDASPANTNGHPIRLFLVNVSAVLGEVRSRAEKLGIDLDFNPRQESEE